MHPITLRVLPNPYATGLRSLDPQGRGQTAVQFFTSPGRYVGARRGLSADATVTFEFELRAVAVLCDTPVALGYYVRALQDGALVAADAETAAHAGSAFAADPLDAIERARNLAAEEFRSAYGREPSCVDDVFERPPPVVVEEETHELVVRTGSAGGKVVAGDLVAFGPRRYRIAETTLVHGTKHVRAVRDKAAEAAERKELSKRTDEAVRAYDDALGKYPAPAASDAAVWLLRRPGVHADVSFAPKLPAPPEAPTEAPSVEDEETS